MKKIFLLTFLIPFFGLAQFKNLVKKATKTVKQTTQSVKQSAGGASSLSNFDIGAGLKEALNNGVRKQVTKLTAVDGFYKNEAVKILMPGELGRVNTALHQVGLGNLADEGVKSLNRAAEDAVKEATPIFVQAIKDMSITDAKSILKGNNTAATTYLQNATSTSLYAKFRPVVTSSIGKVGADKIWATIIKKYNGLPLVTKVNPDISDYVTNKAMEGVFKMIAVEEKNIRGNLSARTSDLLKKVFAMQDKKL